MLPSSELAVIAKECEHIFLRHNIIKAWVFGSFAKAAQTPDSDVDFVFSFRNTPTLFTLGQIKYELENVLSRPCDVLTYDSLKNDEQELSKKIQSEAQLIYAEPKISA